MAEANQSKKGSQDAGRRTTCGVKLVDNLDIGTISPGPFPMIHPFTHTGSTVITMPLAMLNAKPFPPGSLV